MAGKALAARIDAVSTAYSRDFAGRDRRSRDLTKLDALLAESQAISRILERKIGPMRPDERKLLQRATHMRDLLTRERAEVVAEKQRPGPSEQEIAISEPAGRASVYETLLALVEQRHADRIDLALLREALEALERCEADMVARTPKERPAPWMVGNLNTLRGKLAALREQHEEIARTLETAPLEARRELLHQLAFDARALRMDDVRLYPSPVRRPSRLAHVVSSSRWLATRVRALGGLTGGDGDALSDLESIAAQAASEHETLVTERAAKSEGEYASALETELAALASTYAAHFTGKMRKDADLELMERIALRSANVAIQASDLWNLERSARHEKLRKSSRERHHRDHSEVEAIRGWKQGRYT